MFPKRIHMIWIGPREPLWPCIDTWRRDFVRAFPEWQVWLWRDPDIDRFGLKNRREYDQVKALCGKADIARYEILDRHGGVYIDADSVWLGRPLDPLLAEAEETGFFAAHEGSPDLLVCGFFGSVARHAILRAVIEQLPERLERLAGEPQWVQTGPALLGEMVQRLQRDVSSPLATVLPFERLIAAGWHGITAAFVPDLVAKYRLEGDAISLQLGYSTNHLWESRIDIGRQA